MRKARACYHAAIRQVRRNETKIVNNRIAAALSVNTDKDAWSEIKRIRHNKFTASCFVDGLCNSSNIANMFADKYQVPYDVVEMEDIRNDLSTSLFYSGPHPASLIHAHDVFCAINNLKSGKTDGASSLSSDHFIYALVLCVSTILVVDY